MRPKLARIIEAVEETYGLPRRSLYERTNRHTIARPRQVAIWLAREITRMSSPEIGIHFHGMHHTTVLYSARTIERLLVSDCELHAEIFKILTTYSWLGLTRKQI